MAQIYRVGKDIFDASTNQKIANPTVLATQYKGSTEIQAPNLNVPTGATKILNPAGLQGLNESQLYRSGKDIYKLPSAISSDMITGGTAPTIKPVEPSFTDTKPYVAGLDTTTKGLESLVSTALAPTPQEAKVTPITSKISELTGEFEQKPVDYQAELDKYGFKTNVQDLQNLNTQIASKKAEYDSAIQSQEGRAGLAGSIYGRQALLARQSAVELGGLSSMAQALQGNVQMAQNIADKTIAIKYEPVEQEIANQKYQLEQVYSQLTRDEKKKADALKITLDERQRLIDTEKETEANINKIMTAAAQNGADTNTLQKIMSAKDVNQAVINAGGFLQDAAKGNLQDLGNGNWYNPNTGKVQTISQLTATANLGSPVGTIMGLTSYDTRATNPGVNRSDRNNNPGNIKVSEYTKTFNGVAGVESTPAQDGGNFLIFDSPESGINAIGQLLKDGKSYKGVTAEQAIKKYNGNGAYGATTVGLIPNQDFQSQISDPIKLQAVATAIAKAEGFTGTSVTSTSDTKNMADAIIAGNAKLTDVPQKDRPAVISEIQKSGKNVAEIEQKQATAESTKGEAVSIIDTLLNSKVIGNATGLMSWTTKIPGTGAYSFGRSFDQLRDLLAMGNIDKLKGAMSDKDIEFLRNSATKLALGLPKDEFIAELNKLKLKLQNPTSIINTGETVGNSGTTSSGVGYTIEQ